MTSTLATSWSELQTAFDTVLGLAERRLCLFAPDLTVLTLERTARVDALRRLLASNDADLRIALHDAGRLHAEQPRLLELLQVYGHRMSIRITPPSLHHLCDAMAIADGCHALIQFHREQARHKSIAADADACSEYQHRFEELWLECDTSFNGRPLGL
jgi:hypothetical protein